MGGEGIAIVEDVREVADEVESGGRESIDGGGLLRFVDRTKSDQRRRSDANSSQTRRGLRVALTEPRTCVRKGIEMLREGIARREPPSPCGAEIGRGSEARRWKRREGLSADWRRGLLARSALAPFWN